MTMITEIHKNQLLILFEMIFEGVDLREKGYCTYIPITTNHIEINNVNHYFDENKYYYLSYNEYGEMAVEYSENELEKPSDRMEGRCPRNRIIFKLKDLTQISFTAPSRMHRINPETNKYYYDLFVFKLI